MYHIITAKNRAHLCCGQHYRKRQIGRESTDLSTPTCRSIQGCEQKPDFSGADRITYLLKPGDGEAGPAR
jgi:hypothetical protein